MTVDSQTHLTIIKPQNKISILGIQEIYDYRELLFFFSWRQIKIKYKQTIMGISWAVLQPLFTMIVFSLIFGGLAQIPSEGIPYPLFSYSGLLLWIYFSNSLSQSSTSLVGNTGLLNKIFFPRILIPTSSGIAGLLDYCIAMSILFIMMIYYNVFPNITIFILPIILGTTFLLASGAGYWLSTICVKYRDIQFVLPFFIQLLLFATPVIYPTDIISEQYRWLLTLNPMTGLIECHRACLLGYSQINYTSLLISIVFSVAIFFSGMIYLKKMEREFADYI